MSSPIRVGQIGTRHGQARETLEALRQLDHLYQVVGVVEPDEARRARLAETPAYRGLAWFSEAELLETEGLEAVMVMTGLDELVPTGIRCLEAGCHVHMGKPAGTSMPACRALHALAVDKGLTVQMGYFFRYNPAFEFLFQVIDKGWLGNITEVNGYSGKLAEGALRASLNTYPGGGLQELGGLWVDALVAVLGKPDAVHAWTRKTEREADGFADNQVALFEYPNTVATLRCNHVDPFGFPRREFTVVGDAGYAQIRPIDPAEMVLALSDPQGEYKAGVHQIELEGPAVRFDKEAIDFARAIRGQKALRWDAEHDLAVQESLLLACGLPVD